MLEDSRMKKMLRHPIPENSDCTLWKASLWPPWLVLLKNAQLLESLLLAMQLIISNMLASGCLSSSSPGKILFSQCFCYHPQMLSCCIPHSPANGPCQECSCIGYLSDCHFIHLQIFIIYQSYMQMISIQERLLCLLVHLLKSIVGDI